MKDIKITCDKCGKDLTSEDSGYDKDRLVLRCQSIHNTSNIRFAMVHYPTLDREYHFCDFGCLNKWLSARNDN